MNYLLQATAGSGGFFPAMITILILLGVLYALYELDKFKMKKREQRYRKMTALELQDQRLKKTHVYLFWAIGVHHFALGKWYIGIPYVFIIFWGWVFMWTPLFFIGVVILFFAFCWAVTDLFLISRVVQRRNKLVYKIIEEASPVNKIKEHE